MLAGKDAEQGAGDRREPAVLSDFGVVFILIGFVKRAL